MPTISDRSNERPPDPDIEKGKGKNKKQKGKNSGKPRSVLPFAFARLVVSTILQMIFGIVQILPRILINKLTTKTNRIAQSAQKRAAGRIEKEMNPNKSRNEVMRRMAPKRQGSKVPFKLIALIGILLLAGNAAAADIQPQEVPAATFTPCIEGGLNHLVKDDGSLFVASNTDSFMISYNSTAYVVRVAPEAYGECTGEVAQSVQCGPLSTYGKRGYTCATSYPDLVLNTKQPKGRTKRSLNLTSTESDIVKKNYTGVQYINQVENITNYVHTLNVMNTTLNTGYLTGAGFVAAGLTTMYMSQSTVIGGTLVSMGIMQIYTATAAKYVLELDTEEISFTFGRARSVDYESVYFKVYPLKIIGRYVELVGIDFELPGVHMVKVKGEEAFKALIQHSFSTGRISSTAYWISSIWKEENAMFMHDTKIEDGSYVESCPHETVEWDIKNHHNYLKSRGRRSIFISDMSSSAVCNECHEHYVEATVVEDEGIFSDYIIVKAKEVSNPCDDYEEEEHASDGENYEDKQVIEADGHRFHYSTIRINETNYLYTVMVVAKIVKYVKPNNNWSSGNVEGPWEMDTDVPLKTVNRGHAIAKCLGGMKHYYNGWYEFKSENQAIGKKEQKACSDLKQSKKVEITKKRLPVTNYSPQCVPRSFLKKEKLTTSRVEDLKYVCSLGWNTRNRECIIGEDDPSMSNYIRIGACKDKEKQFLTYPGKSQWDRNTISQNKISIIYLMVTLLSAVTKKWILMTLLLGDMCINRVGAETFYGDHLGDDNSDLPCDHQLSTVEWVTSSNNSAQVQLSNEPNCVRISLKTGSSFTVRLVGVHIEGAMKFREYAGSLTSTYFASSWRCPTSPMATCNATALEPAASKKGVYVGEVKYEGWVPETCGWDTNCGFFGTCSAAACVCLRIMPKDLYLVHYVDESMIKYEIETTSNHIASNQTKVFSLRAGDRVSIGNPGEKNFMELKTTSILSNLRTVVLVSTSKCYTMHLENYESIRDGMATTIKLDDWNVESIRARMLKFTAGFNTIVDIKQASLDLYAGKHQASANWSLIVDGNKPVAYNMNYVKLTKNTRAVLEIVSESTIDAKQYAECISEQCEGNVTHDDTYMLLNANFTVKSYPCIISNITGCTMYTNGVIFVDHRVGVVKDVALICGMGDGVMELAKCNISYSNPNGMFMHYFNRVKATYKSTDSMTGSLASQFKFGGLTSSITNILVIGGGAALTMMAPDMSSKVLIGGITAGYAFMNVASAEYVEAIADQDWFDKPFFYQMIQSTRISSSNYSVSSPFTRTVLPRVFNACSPIYAVTNNVLWDLYMNEKGAAQVLFYIKDSTKGFKFDILMSTENTSNCMTVEYVLANRSIVVRSKGPEPFMFYTKNLTAMEANVMFAFWRISGWSYMSIDPTFNITLSTSKIRGFQTVENCIIAAHCVACYETCQNTKDYSDYLCRGNYNATGARYYSAIGTFNIYYIEAISSDDLWFSLYSKPLEGNVTSIKAPFGGQCASNISGFTNTQGSALLYSKTTQNLLSCPCWSNRKVNTTTVYSLGSRYEGALAECINQPPVATDALTIMPLSYTDMFKNRRVEIRIYQWSPRSVSIQVDGRYIGDKDHPDRSGAIPPFTGFQDMVSFQTNHMIRGYCIRCYNETSKDFITPCANGRTKRSVKESNENNNPTIFRQEVLKVVTQELRKFEIKTRVRIQELPDNEERREILQILNEKFWEIYEYLGKVAIIPSEASDFDIFRLSEKAVTFEETIKEGLRAMQDFLIRPFSAPESGLNKC